MPWIKTREDLEAIEIKVDPSDIEICGGPLEGHLHVVDHDGTVVLDINISRLRTLIESSKAK